MRWALDSLPWQVSHAVWTLADAVGVPTCDTLFVGWQPAPEFAQPSLSFATKWLPVISSWPCLVVTVSTAWHAIHAFALSRPGQSLLPTSIESGSVVDMWQFSHVLAGLVVLAAVPGSCSANMDMSWQFAHATDSAHGPSVALACAEPAVWDATVLA